MLNIKTRHNNTHAAMGLELLPPQDYTNVWAFAVTAHPTEQHALLCTNRAKIILVYYNYRFSRFNPHFTLFSLAQSEDNGFIVPT